nr:STAS domain-containing protein [Bacteroidota bacterium]
MNLKEVKNDKAVIIEIDGRLDTTNYSSLERKLVDHIDNGNINVLIDCSNMDYISSSGLRIFLMALKKITSLKGKFVLCGLQDNIREIFEISGFTSIFPIFDNAQDALADF